MGITEIRAGLLPEDKVSAVRELEADGAKVMLVGDGVNDAPAMAAATVGVAMGRAGSDLALDTADAVITRDDLSTIPAVVALARRARRLVIANLVIAATFITVLVAWDLFGHLPLPSALPATKAPPSSWDSTAYDSCETPPGPSSLRSRQKRHPQGATPSA